MKLFSIVGFLLFFLGCGGETDPSKLFSIELEDGKKAFQQNQEITININNKKDIQIDDITYFVDGVELALSNGKLKMDVPTLGSKNLIAKIHFEEKTVEISKKIRLLAPKAPQVYTYDIINSYPHDTKAYTQGLEFYNDTLYESTGKKGASSVRKVNFETGKILQKIDLDANDFGEGITLMDNKIYNLTWRSSIGYVYNASNLKKIKDFGYGQSKEGWGLCNDGKKLFKSDGTEKIWFLNPDTLEEEGYIETATNKSIFNRANELEYVDGKIYANVYGKEGMMIIDAVSGAIEGVVNFGGLKKMVKKDANWDETNSVLNGVAYHKGRNTFFVTGKNWDKLFEVKIRKKN